MQQDLRYIGNTFESPMDQIIIMSSSYRGIVPRSFLNFIVDYFDLVSLFSITRIYGLSQESLLCLIVSPELSLLPPGWADDFNWLAQHLLIFHLFQSEIHCIFFLLIAVVASLWLSGVVDGKMPAAKWNYAVSHVTTFPAISQGIGSQRGAPPAYHRIPRRLKIPPSIYGSRIIHYLLATWDQGRRNPSQCQPLEKRAPYRNCLFFVVLIQIALMGLADSYMMEVPEFAGLKFLSSIEIVIHILNIL